MKLGQERIENLLDAYINHSIGFENDYQIEWI